MRDGPEPEIDRDEAIALCGQVHQSHADAMAVACRLRAAGWIVPIHDTPAGPRPDGTCAIAAVHDPQTFRRVGEVSYRADT